MTYVFLEKNTNIYYLVSMKQYISMLRGINVSGQKKIKMADLRAMYESLGFQQVNSYIQSGNVAFACPSKSNSKLEEMISKGIKDTFGFDVPVWVRTKDYFEKAIKECPFKTITEETLKYHHLTFLGAIPSADLVKALETLDFSPDVFVIKEDRIFIHCPQGYGRSKLNNNFFERKLKVKATTRNWKSVNVLYGMVE